MQAHIKGYVEIKLEYLILEIPKYFDSILVNILKNYQSQVTAVLNRNFESLILLQKNSVNLKPLDSGITYFREIILIFQGLQEPSEQRTVARWGKVLSVNSYSLWYLLSWL